MMCGIKGTFPKNTLSQLGECAEIQYSMNPMEQDFVSTDIKWNEQVNNKLDEHL